VTLLAPQPDGIPLPTVTEVSAPFWDGCARGELLFQRSVCGRIIWIPEATCRWCGSDEHTWERGAGKGEVYSWSVAYRPVSPAFHAPYAAVIVALDEGYRILSNLVGCEVDDVREGLRVRVVFRAYEGGITLPLFEPER
jgi:uncharacterized OB-fold protein